ncbi:MAG: flagellar motor protein MotB [Alphaproteobacteria bacterium]|nr:MAG: flagellar motor protein MotB [Alphaproteobacteria bacterium]
MAVSKEAEEVVVEDAFTEDDCPKCPPVGAPAWMSTFADMATLLMAFFVLILSFAEFNVPKFKQISGSLKNAFGVQRVLPVVEQPKGTTILSLNFSPSPSPSVQETVRQKTTLEEEPNLDLQTKDKDEDFKDDTKELAKAVEEAVARGDIDIQVLGKNVVLNFTPTEAEEKELPQLLQETLNAIEKAKSAAGKSEKDILVGGIEDKLEQVAKALDTAQEALDKQNKEKEEFKDATEKADLTEESLKVALKQEIGQGLVTVEKKEDKVIVTVGAGGAFPSGTAQLTPAAKKIMSNIAEVNKKGNSNIKVTGHTDNVPLLFGSQYRDNWDLAAARAASVVQNLQETNVIDAKRLIATSKGETQPIASNQTRQGRSKNRRIEIEINYGK